MVLELINAVSRDPLGFSMRLGYRALTLVGAGWLNTTLFTHDNIASIWPSFLGQILSSEAVTEGVQMAVSITTADYYPV